MGPSVHLRYSVTVTQPEPIAIVGFELSDNHVNIKDIGLQF